ncbi:MAG: coenzyme F430 synthase [Methanobacteriaceae archaeon]
MKKILVVDMTHGGTIIASELSKRTDAQILAWDLYHTMDEEGEAILDAAGVQLLDDNFRSDQVDDDWMVVAPVHSQLNVPVGLTHHQAVRLLLEDEIKVPILELTGVKGKTSTVAVLKEIYRHHNPLILSSLGVEAVEGDKTTILLKDISITPASIITAWNLALKEQFHPGMCIFETSLGGTGLAEVGILTNLAEDYAIAGGSKRASQAKEQIFQSQMVVCHRESFHSLYSSNKIFKDKTNTFSLDGEANLSISQVKYGIEETSLILELENLKNITGKLLNTSIPVKTFAPGPHLLENVLSAACAAFTLGTSEDEIVAGLNNFKGIKGRTSIREIDDVRIVQEVNPGINLTAIEKSVAMMTRYGSLVLVLGGQYGVTCEEIDENLLAGFLDELPEDITLILTDELGKSLDNKLNRVRVYKNDLENAMNMAIGAGASNVLLIYRSHFASVEKR